MERLLAAGAHAWKAGNVKLHRSWNKIVNPPEGPSTDSKEAEIPLPPQIDMYVYMPGAHSHSFKKKWQSIGDADKGQRWSKKLQRNGITSEVSCR